MTRVYDKLGSWVLPRELEDIGLENTHQYGPYKYETQNKQTFSQLSKELELMPELGDHYIRAEILLPRGDEMALGHELVQSYNAYGNIMDRAHANPILHTRTYQVKFAVDKVSMYDQCDVDGNEYLFQDALVHYLEDKKVISLTEQQTHIQGRPSNP